MRYVNVCAGETLVGLAYSPHAVAFARSRPASVDYIELPFEQLRHDPRVGSIQNDIPVILHCASMSMAGFVPPASAIVDALACEVDRTRSPWIGEHLAFLSAEPLDTSSSRDEPIQLTYTVTPQYSEEVLVQVVANVDRLAPCVHAPIILENSPQYLALPGSTMTMVEFIAALVAACDVRLLLDLSHFAITAHNMGYDVGRVFDQFPLESVVEVHMSGHSLQSGIMWDDHAVPAPEASFRLLERLLERTRPSALTFEYNWGHSFPDALIEGHIDRVRSMIARA